MEVDAGEPPAKRRRSSAPLFCQPVREEAFRVQSRHDTGVKTCAFTLEGAPLILGRFTEAMNSIRAERAVDLYRYKGVVCIREPSGGLKMAVLQGVHDMCEFQPRGPWSADVPPK